MDETFQGTFRFCCTENLWKQVGGTRLCHMAHYRRFADAVGWYRMGDGFVIKDYSLKVYLHKGTCPEEFSNC